MITATIQMFDSEEDGKTKKAISVLAQGDADPVEKFYMDIILGIVSTVVDCITEEGAPLTDEAKQNCLLLICQAVNVAAVRSQLRPDELMREALPLYAKHDKMQRAFNARMRKLVEKAIELVNES